MQKSLSVGIFILCASFFSLPASPAGIDNETLHTLSNDRLVSTVSIHQCTEAELNMLLPELHRRFPGFQKRLGAIAQMYEGAPYVVDPLTDELKNWLPYSKTNCTMFVLYAAALANSSSYDEARTHMRQLHYRNGMVGFTARYHFTSDRITDPVNRYFTDITKQYIKNMRNLKEVTVELNKKKDGGYFFGERLGTWSRRVAMHYIPRDGFRPDMLRQLPEAAGIAFVKKAYWDKGIIIGHEGLLVGADLVHSSPGKGVIIVKNYLAREFPGSQWEGMVLFCINEVK